MQLPFFKYQGTGNDFIILDGWYGLPDLSEPQIKHLCDRRFGIGADGIMIFKKHPEADFEMIYYNADGKPGSMCGNGGRCLVQFGFRKGYIGKQTRFIAIDGLHEASIDLNREWVSLKMGDVSEVKLREGGDCYLNTGSPHFIRWVDVPEKVDILAEGRLIRNSIEFRQFGTNVNFVKVGNDKLYVRTYERGVEDETLSCGTGVTASVLAAAFAGKLDREIGGSEVSTPGGELYVRFKKANDGFVNVWLEGPAEFVYEGNIELL
jgi:diaminopimelate epimerase